MVDDGRADAAVTLNGELVRKGGVIRGGTVSKTEGRTVGKKERMDRLTSAIEMLRSEAAEIESEISDLNEEAETIEPEDLQRELDELKKKADSAAKEISRRELKLESLANNIANIEENMERFNEEIAEAETDEGEMKEDFESLGKKLTAAESARTATAGELEGAEDNLAEWDEKNRQTEVESARLKTETSGIEKEIVQLGERKVSAEKRAAQRKEELENNINTAEKLEEKINETSEKLELAKLNLDKARNRTELLAEQKSSLNEQSESQSESMKQIRRAYEKVVENLHEKELSLNEYRNQLRNISIKLREQYETDPDIAEIKAEEDFDMEQARAEVTRLREKLGNIGNVNFMALDEYEKESERLEFYEKQVADLTEAEKTLQETILEINETAERNFMTTFEEVQTNFKKLFVTLFGEEGEADVRLAEGNILESDINITAKPPGKRPHTIDMLSGGEKTLTAIALLFAIYLVKPSPFCILDEVDAPLDDANIDKFIKMIKEFSKNTQFMIVTHNKRTMSACDTMYGITMQEDGVSKVVSVRLSKQAVQ
jgi:chromosome segregation protein